MKTYLLVYFIDSNGEEKANSPIIAVKTETLLSVSRAVFKYLRENYINKGLPIMFCRFSYYSREYSISIHEASSIFKLEPYKKGLMYANVKCLDLETRSFTITSSGNVYLFIKTPKGNEYFKVKNGKFDFPEYISKINKQKGTITIWLKYKNRLLNKWILGNYSKEQLTFLEHLTQDEYERLIKRKAKEENKSWWDSLNTRVKRETRKQVEQFKKKGK